MKSIDDIKTILVAGAGTLGLRIALRCALDGYQVRMFDINEQQLEAAQSMQSHLAKGLLKRQQITSEQFRRFESSILATDDLDRAASGVDLVSESVIEDLDIKLNFYEGLTSKLDGGTIVTTNTSFLLPSQMLPAIREPQNFCALHFHDVFTQVVLDVMPHPQTSPAVIDLLMEFGPRIQHIPVFVQKENHGYMFNAMFGEILAKAGEMHMNNVGSIQDIDRSFMGNFHTPAGPFGMLDMIGLDTAWHIMSKRDSESVRPFANELKRKVDAGELGYKSGRGFYDYPRPEFTNADFLKKQKDS